MSRATNRFHLRLVWDPKPPCESAQESHVALVTREVSHIEAERNPSGILPQDPKKSYELLLIVIRKSAPLIAQVLTPSFVSRKNVRKSKSNHSRARFASHGIIRRED